MSISGGKDSTVLAHLALTEAHKRGSSCKAAEEADQFIREQGLILAMTDDEEYAREEVTKLIGRWN